MLMSSPPDVILEVGPAPNNMRFVAHSIVLGMHSGYLRSAIRLDENSNAPHHSDIILYLGNVTPEQFAPLLTYMYTGYLDLNLENIFAILLATHVLHMPRALEICRSFLARAQADGYLGNRLTNLSTCNTQHPQSSAAASGSVNNSNKIIRPIASKATLPNFGFLPTPNNAASHMPPSTPALPPATLTPLAQQLMPMAAVAAIMPPFNKSLMQRGDQRQSLEANLLIKECRQEHSHHQHGVAVEKESNALRSEEHESLRFQREKSIEIEVDDQDTRDTREFKPHSENSDNNTDEDEEVFIESLSERGDDADDDEAETAIDSEAEVIIECKVNSNYKGKSHNKHLGREKNSEQNFSKTKSPSKDSTVANINKTQIKTQNRHAANQKRERRRQSRQKSSNSGLQVAKAPIPASQLSANEGSKVIIDVASCDGPVRFRRILNTAYGHKPEDVGCSPRIASGSVSGGGVGGSGRSGPINERTQQSVSFSFHQQMAKTINQQRQHQQKMLQQNAEESENSESSSQSGSARQTQGSSNKTTNSNEIYVCVYCKHTFKSQYCYQKHAKRHLNPLSLNPCSGIADVTALSNSVALNVAASEIREKLHPNNGGADQFSNSNNYTQPKGLMATMVPPLLISKQNATAELLRREVRPLDMNVQYYPCKTCGSKFPSYYFVHKHRKMCHADEEMSQNASTNNQTSNNADSSGNVQRNDDEAESNEDIRRPEEPKADQKEAESHDPNGESKTAGGGTTPKFNPTIPP